MYSLSRILLLGLPVLACLSACSDSDERQPDIKLPQVNQAKGFAGPLTVGAAGKAEQFVKNGIYALTVVDEVPTPSNGMVAGPISVADEGYSTTNTIEQGVDESDRIKYDGDTLFIATYPVWSQGQQVPAHIRVLQRNSDFSLTALNDIPLAESVSNIQGLYLHEQRLASVAVDQPMYPVDSLVTLPWEPTSPAINIAIHDVRNPAAISAITNIEIEGGLLSTRRLGDELYVVSRFTPHVDNLANNAVTDAQKLQNYRTITQTPAEQLMPTLRVDGQSTAMNAIEQCYVPSDATAQDGYAQLITVTRINLLSPTDIESMCMGIYASMLYMSQHNIYLSERTASDRTVFHKLSLQGLTYQASGGVEGDLGWRSDPRFRVNEHGDFLRVVSTRYSDTGPQHQLSVLTQQDTELVAVASLPNAQQDEPIGKPGEDIYAVRFTADKAYVVTFERIDPLYVIDLADNRTPFIAGSLEVPGFSSYLHPLENDLLLGVGQDVEVATIPASGAQTPPAVVTSGMKVSLFDVRDPANPLELSSIHTADAYTPVEFNYKALSVLQTEGVYQFAIPVEQWVTQDAAADPTVVSTFMLPLNSLMLLSTDSRQAMPELTQVASMAASNDPDNYVYAGDDRSVLHGDWIYYVHGNQVWRSNWQAPDVVQGPF